MEKFAESKTIEKNKQTKTDGQTINKEINICAMKIVCFI